MVSCLFLYVEVSREGNKFVTIVYCKPTFSGVYTHFDSFLPTTYKFSRIYTLVVRYFSICSNQTNCHNELVFLEEIFLKNGYPISFIEKCFKTFLDRLFLKPLQVLTAAKKTIALVSPFLGKFPFKPGQSCKYFLKGH